MTDNELLLAISSMMDTKLEHITKDVQNIKKDIKKVNTRLENVELKVGNIEKDVNEVNSRIRNIELALENDIKPPLNNIQACYTSTYDRYKDSVEDYESIKQDIEIMKKVITEHSEKLHKLAQQPYNIYYTNNVKSIELSRTLHFFISGGTTMIKEVTYFEYQALKVIGKKVTVLKANDSTAIVVIGKQLFITATIQYQYLSELITRWQLIQLVNSVKSNKNCNTLN